ncbi:MAG: signal peptidase II [Sphingomicrobium sp.]|nr:signal peptidase II [Sphingomonadales bacterium]
MVEPIDPPRNGEVAARSADGGGPHHASHGPPPRAGEELPQRNRAIAFAIAGLTFLADQLAKWFVTGPAGLTVEGDQRFLLPIFSLSRTHNHGISLGLFRADSEAARWALVIVTAAIAVSMLVWILKEPRHGDRLALGLVLGGAIGNILDRVRFGYVVDYADLHFGAFRPFLVFNIADAAISIGVVILLLRAFLLGDGSSKENINA